MDIKYDAVKKHSLLSICISHWQHSVCRVHAIEALRYFIRALFMALYLALFSSGNRRFLGPSEHNLHEELAQPTTASSRTPRASILYSKCKWCITNVSFSIRRKQDRVCTAKNCRRSLIIRILYQATGWWAVSSHPNGEWSQYRNGWSRYFMRNACVVKVTGPKRAERAPISSYLAPAERKRLKFWFRLPPKRIVAICLRMVTIVTIVTGLRQHWCRPVIL
jgi:hypothetical protein